MLLLVQKTLSIGIDLGGTSLRVGLFDSSMVQLDSCCITTRVSAGPDAVVGDMANCIRQLTGMVDKNTPLAGIGIGSPGPLDLRRGVLGLLPNFPGWDGYPLRDKVAGVSSLSVFLESDANAAAIAEWQLGAGREANVESLAVITLGTGVGSGLIMHGHVCDGITGMGGEIGHVSIDHDGPECPCGSRGCLELYASSSGVIRLAHKYAAASGSSAELKEMTSRSSGFTAHEVAQLAELGDAGAMQVFQDLGSRLGFGIAGLINTLNPPLIVIGGGVASAWKLFAPSMFASIRRYSIVYRLGEPSQVETMEPDKTFIRPAALGPAAGLLGAALLPFLAGTRGKPSAYGQNPSCSVDSSSAFLPDSHAVSVGLENNCQGWPAS